MALTFNTLLADVGINAEDVRLIRHKDNRADPGRSPYDLWLYDRPAFDLYQSIQNISDRAILNTAQFWAVFAGLKSGETVFLSLYQNNGGHPLQADMPRPHREGNDLAIENDQYQLVSDPRLVEYSERIVIQWGAGYINWIQRAANQPKPIVEIRARKTDEQFPGFDAFMKPLSMIETLPETWRAILRNTRGVYLLTCPRTNEHYVGSASGTGGFWERWLQYVANGHGGNLGLRNREPSDYQITILATASNDATELDIVRLESLWKRKLRSRLNLN